MKHLFVPYEIALKLKEKGFDEPCLGVIFENGVVRNGSEEFVRLLLEKLSPCLPAPLYQQVIDWFREKHNVIISVQRAIQHTPELYGYQINYGDAGDGGMMSDDPLAEYPSYYQALNKAIEEALYTESQVRTAYKAGVLRGLEYKSRGKKKTVYETPSEEQLIQTLKKKL